MPLFHLTILAIIQGLTEFLPLSSSGHLALAPHLLDWPDQGLTIDVAVHVGTLGAVLIYLWRDLGHVLMGLLRALKGRTSEGFTLFLQISIATIPVVIAGYVVSRYLGDMLRTVEVIAWSTLVFGVLLGLSDRIGMTIRRLQHMTYATALLIGLSQALALVPGTSRSGITITAARVLGFERTEAARFSLLLGIPAILGAAILESMKIYESGDLQFGFDAAVAAGLSFVAALASIALMMAWLRRATFLPFVLYRIVLGSGLIAWVYL